MTILLESPFDSTSVCFHVARKHCRGHTQGTHYSSTPTLITNGHIIPALAYGRSPVTLLHTYLVSVAFGGAPDYDKGIHGQVT